MAVFANEMLSLPCCVGRPLFGGSFLSSGVDLFHHVVVTALLLFSFLCLLFVQHKTRPLPSQWPSRPFKDDEHKTHASAYHLPGRRTGLCYGL